MYRVMINGYTVECETRDEVIGLIGGAVPNNPAQSTTRPTAAPAPLPSAPMLQSVIPGFPEADDSQSKWYEPARKIIALLVQAGDGGVDADHVAAVAGLKSAKGSSPLLKAINKMLGIGDTAIARSRNDEGKRRWVLTSKGRKAAAKHDQPHAEAGRP